MFFYFIIIIIRFSLKDQLLRFPQHDARRQSLPRTRKRRRRSTDFFAADKRGYRESSRRFGRCWLKRRASRQTRAISLSSSKSHERCSDHLPFPQSALTQRTG